MKSSVLLLVALLFGAANPYAAMAPVDQYRVADRNAEIALARSAAPPSIADRADVLVLGKRGYESAAHGSNGFVCLVMRSWYSGFDDPEFWNQKERSPICLNAAAARTELPQILTRTQWALEGLSKAEMIAKTRAAFASHTFKTPEANAMSYMLSKHGYLSDDAQGPWLPHVMFFVKSAQAKLWGAGLPGSPVIDGPSDDSLGATVLMISARKWSDGTLAAPPVHHMNH